MKALVDLVGAGKIGKLAASPPDLGNHARANDHVTRARGHVGRLSSHARSAAPAPGSNGHVAAPTGTWELSRGLLAFFDGLLEDLGDHARAHSSAALAEGEAHAHVQCHGLNQLTNDLRIISGHHHLALRA